MNIVNKSLLSVAVVLLVVVCRNAQAAEPVDYPHVLISTSMGDIIAELYPDSAPQTVNIFLGLASGERAWKDPTSNEMVRRPYYDGTIFHRVIADFMIQGGDPLGSGSGGAGFTFADEINAIGLGLDQQFVLSQGQLHQNMAYMQDMVMSVVIRPRLEAQGLGPDSPKADVNAAFSKIISGLENTYTLMDFYQDLGYKYNKDLVARRPLAGSLAMANSGPNTNSGQFFINLGDTPHLEGKHTVFGQVISGFDVLKAIGAVETGEKDKPLKSVTIDAIRVVTITQIEAVPTQPETADEPGAEPKTDGENTEPTPVP